LTDHDDAGTRQDKTGDRTTAVWLVEDNTFLRETVSELLERTEAVRCTLAVPTCEEAIAALQAGERPHVLLMDLGLPGMSGLAGIRSIKEIDPTILVVVLTVHEDDDKIFDALCAGASGYLLKPASGESIIDAIETVRRGGSPMNAFIARRVLTMFGQLARPATDYGLTDREREILQLAVGERTKRQIADALALSPHTVDSHLRSIYSKLQVRSRGGAVAKAIRDRLV
jgi:DNA-binding NarL/FixJ family response regulator